MSSDRERGRGSGGEPEDARREAELMPAVPAPAVPASAGGRPPADIIDPEGFANGPQPIGAYLRRQRILRGIDVEELSAQTRIPVRSLERLEGGHFDGDVDGFVRGFVRTVAEGLGLDPEDTISRMLREPTAADYASGEPSPSLRRAAAGLALVLAFVLGVGLVRAVTVALSSAGEGTDDEAVVYWRDPVRALADAYAAERDRQREMARSE